MNKWNVKISEVDVLKCRRVQTINIRIFETLGKLSLKLFCHTYFYITGQHKLCDSSGITIFTL